MKNKPERPYPFHNQHLQSIHKRPLLRQKSNTVIPFQTHIQPNKNNLASIQNLEVFRKESAKPKIQFNYTPSTPKYRQNENYSVKTGNSSPKANLSPQKIPPQTFENTVIVQNIEIAQQKHLNKQKEAIKFTKTIFRQQRLNSYQIQTRKEVKSRTLNNKYEVIAEVLPTLEVSRHQRDEEIVLLKRQLNQTRSQNNQLRTELLRWERRFEQIDQTNRKKTDQLIQQIKQLKIQLQKTQNQKLLAQVSEAEMQKRIRKMLQEKEEREKLQRVREDYKLKPFQGDNERVYQKNISYQPYIQLYVNQPQ